MKLAHGQNRPNPTNSISDESSSSQQILDGDQTEPENSTTDESRKPKKTVGQVNCQYCSQKFSNSSSSAFQKHVEAHGNLSEPTQPLVSLTEHISTLSFRSRRNSHPQMLLLLHILPNETGTNGTHSHNTSGACDMRHLR